MHMNHQARPLSSDGRAKLNRMLGTLRRVGIEARKNFLCCQSCAVNKMAEILSLRTDAIGYVFYTKQDGIRSEEEPGMWLSFGAASDLPVRGHAAVGRRIAAAAQDEGLYVIWDGSSEKRIYVTEVPPS